MARSVSAMDSISPERMPRDLVVAAPMTRKLDCPAIEPMASPDGISLGPSKRRIKQATLELPTSITATTPRWMAALRIARMVRWD